MKGIEIIDIIVKIKKLRISNDEFEIVLRFLEVDSNLNFRKTRNFFHEDFVIKIKYLFNFLNENIDDLRLFNFFLKNKKVLNSLKLDFLYHNIYI
tara:strand:+ start:1731 stop:2015 length:285 start_codon:yes stop_codon:yes gene_type:complete